MDSRNILPRSGTRIEVFSYEELLTTLCQKCDIVRL